jgi:hypothetical protein
VSVIIEQLAALRDLIARKPEVVYGTVTQVAPLRVRLDGDSVALPYTPPIFCDPGALVVDGRVICSHVQGQRQVVTGILNACPHAVGDYFLTEATTSPADRWPGTTWVELAGRVLVGRDATQTEFDTVGEEGGHKALQAHAHGISAADAAGAATVVLSSANTETPVRSVGTATAGTGDSQNLQPYRVCYVWRRTG